MAHQPSSFHFEALNVSLRCEFILNICILHELICGRNESIEDGGIVFIFSSFPSRHQKVWLGRLDLVGRIMDCVAEKEFIRLRWWPTVLATQSLLL